MRWCIRRAVPHLSMSSDNDLLQSQGRPPNIVNDGTCSNCKSQESEEFVSCLFCKRYFHLYDCFEDSDNDVLPSSCGKSFYKAINKTGKYSNRPGNFRFVCDPYLTNFENKQTCTSNDHVQMLDNKVNSLAGDVCSIKEMLKDMKEAGVSHLTPGLTPANEVMASNEVNGNVNSVITNVWQDKDRVLNLSLL